jgi:DNA-binding MarR family transcriptional regulator
MLISPLPPILGYRYSFWGHSSHLSRSEDRMNIALGKRVKLDLPLVAQFVCANDGAPSRKLLEDLQARFGCGRRAAQDALSILVRGGWLERRDDQDDARRKEYFVTQRGREALRTLRGEREMRFARWSYSTTSTRARKRRRREPDEAEAVTNTLLDALKVGASAGLDCQLRLARLSTLDKCSQF